MKKRFGNKVFTGTLTSGLYPIQYKEDVIRTTQSFSVELNEGMVGYDTLAADMPIIVSGTLEVTAAYPVITPPATDTLASSMPIILSGTLETTTRYIDIIPPSSDSVASDMPIILSGSLRTSVILHEIYDADTLNTTQTFLVDLI